MVFKFTIDNILNKHIPRNKLDKLPKVVRRFLGQHKSSPKADYLIWLEIFVASFCGLALLEGIFKHNTVFTKHHAPMIIASYGATAILCFNASQVPLAQPRNIFIGHFVSSLIGICIQKLFSLSSQGRDNYWVSGALSVGVASVIMSILNCVHPPAGASALLPSIDEQIRQMSWWYLPVQIISSILIIIVALITGNIFRSYPTYWWTPVALHIPQPVEDTTELQGKESVTKAIEGITYLPNIDSIEIRHDEILAPEGINLDEIDVDWLNSIQLKLNQLSNGLSNINLV